MTAFAPILPDDTNRTGTAMPVQQTATVISAGPDTAILDHHGRIAPARIALSCLVQPEPGDRVLVAVEEETWVTSVLTRPGPAPLRLLAATSAVIGGPATTLTLNAGELNVHAATATTVIDEVLHSGTSVTGHLAALKIIAGAVETVAQRIMAQAKSYLRTVDDTDQLRARTIDHAASAAMHHHADCIFVTGGTAIRLDAGQIHMG
jgi:hypothetical protein